MQRAEALKEIIQSQYGHGHWRAGCGENRMPGSVGGRRKRVRTRGYLAGGLPCGGSVSVKEQTARDGDTLRLIQHLGR